MSSGRVRTVVWSWVDGSLWLGLSFQRGWLATCWDRREVRWSGERSPQPGSLDCHDGLLLTAGNAGGVVQLAVYAAHLLELASSAREALDLVGHESSPLMRALAEHEAEALLVVVACVAPASPHAVAYLDCSLLALLPWPAFNGA